MHGNLRLENIIIFIDNKHKYIENVAFIGFEYLSMIDDDDKF